MPHLLWDNGKPSIVDLYAQTDLGFGEVVVEVDLSNPSTEQCQLVLYVRDGRRILGSGKVEFEAGQDHGKTRVKLRNFERWPPEHPKLYTLEISLFMGGRKPIDKVGIRFGMRELVARGTKFYLNGKPVLLRFFGDNHLHPDTLCPPADKKWYLPRLKLARKFGMNGVKGCVETIPQSYIEAADEVGIMVIQEMPFGLSGLRENRYTIGANFRDYYSHELEGLVRTSRNHPSVVSYSMSSELEFNKQTQESFDFFSRELVLRTKKLAPHALVVDCTGYSGADKEDTPRGKRCTDYYATLMPKHKDVLDEPTLKTDGLHPIILHEYYWWSCYPDVRDREKYEKPQIVPYWLEALARTARENGQEDLVHIYRENSLWSQALCRKDGIEYVRRNPNVEGYIL